MIAGAESTIAGAQLSIGGGGGRGPPQKYTNWHLCFCVIYRSVTLYLFGRARAPGHQWWQDNGSNMKKNPISAGFWWYLSFTLCSPPIDLRKKTYNYGHLILVFTTFHDLKLNNKAQYLMLISILSDYLFFETQKSSTRTDHSAGEHFSPSALLLPQKLYHTTSANAFYYPRHALTLAPLGSG